MVPPPPGPPAPVPLGRQRVLRRLLLALLAQRQEAPGRPLSLEELFRAGWPGARIAPSSAARRTYVALGRLRDAGLRGLIVTHADGDLLDPAVPVVLQPPLGCSGRAP